MAYTNSSLVKHTRISPNKTSPRNHKIDTISIHCVVGQCTIEALGSHFAISSTKASSNYGIGSDGKVGMYVEEKDRSWCTSNAANDHRAITIEVASDTTHPYAVNDKAYAALIDLLVDICKRNDIKKLVWSTDKNERVNHLNGCNMTVHRDYSYKSCPGQYLYERHGKIAEEVNKRLGVNTDSVASTDKDISDNKNNSSEIYRIRKTWADAKSQKGAFKSLENAKVSCDRAGSGYFVFNSSGVAVYPVKESEPTTSNKRIDTVKEVQDWANKNYSAGIASDGVYGAKTKKALIKILQQELKRLYNSKLVVDGIWGILTRSACPVLKKGAKNNIVSVLQALLICNGYSEAYIDGSYGSGTEASVKAYQKKNGLYADGIAGKDTFAKLCK